MVASFLVTLLALLACSSPKPRASAAMIEAVQQARDRVCQCTDKVCAQAAQEAYRVWKRTPASLHRHDLTEAQIAHLSQLEQQMQVCVAALGTPAVPPPVPAVSLPVAP